MLANAPIKLLALEDGRREPKPGASRPLALRRIEFRLLNGCVVIQ